MQGLGKDLWVLSITKVAAEEELALTPVLVGVPAVWAKE